MQCTNHPNVEALERCAGCAEAFCQNCLVALHGEKYCGSCKVMAIKGQPALEEGTIPCKEAGEALTTAIIGLFCFGIFLEPMAIAKAFKAKSLIAADPRLTGSGKATAALIIAFIGLGLWVLGLIAKIAAVGQR